MGNMYQNKNKESRSEVKQHLNQSRRVKMKRFLLIILALSMTLSLGACGVKDTNSSNLDNSGNISEEGTDPIVVGFLGWSSGPDALYGLVPQYLMEDYVAKVNEEGGWLGRKIDFRPYDISGTGGDFSEAVNATNKLLQEGAVAILGPSNSAQGTAVAELCNKAGVLHIPSSAAQLVTVDESGAVRPYTFRCGPMNDDLVVALANYAYHELDKPKIAILYETTLVDCVAMYNAFSDAYKGLGGEIVGVATYQVEDIEFRAQLTSLAKDNPDYIFMPAMAYKEVGNAAKQLNELGYGDKIKLLGTSVYDASELVEIAGKELAGTIFATNGDVDSSKFDDIKEEYNKNHGDSGMAVHMSGLISFNSIKILEHAILNSGSTDPKVLKETLEKTEGFEMFTGPNTGYDASTHNLEGLEFTIKRFSDGQVENLGVYAPK
jgi:branched-chain amino acid transport system substrate-binding protein